MDISCDQITPPDTDFKESNAYLISIPANLTINNPKLHFFKQHKIYKEIFDEPIEVKLYRSQHFVTGKHIKCLKISDIKNSPKIPISKAEINFFIKRDTSVCLALYPEEMLKNMIRLERGDISQLKGLHTQIHFDYLEALKALQMWFTGQELICSVDKVSNGWEYSTGWALDNTFKAHGIANTKNDAMKLVNSILLTAWQKKVSSYLASNNGVYLPSDCDVRPKQTKGLIPYPWLVTETSENKNKGEEEFWM
jgi:hypothetical protein